MSVAIPPLAALGAVAPATQPGSIVNTVHAGVLAGLDFGGMVKAGLREVDAKLDAADALVRRFAVDDSIPVHRVTLALEEARLAVELAMQVRTRLIEGYRELMNMQL